MLNLSILAEARKNCPSGSLPFLTRLREKLMIEKPYIGISIFHNTPLTLQTVMKVEPLILGGADVTVSSITSLAPHQAAIDILTAAGIKVKLDHNINQQYDIYLDCCAELINAPKPLYGSVELTQTGTVIYKKYPPKEYPIISVDDCKLKHLENMGTGESFVEAIQNITSKELKNKKFLVFGYGKVGRGIVKALLKYTNDIVVVEKNEQFIPSTCVYNVKFLTINDIEDIKKQIEDTFCVVTATGVESLISNYFNKDTFNNVYLANMGAQDEYGAKFSEKDVLFKKQALNFYINEPNPRYLDAIFYAHNICIDILLNKELSNGYHAFDNNLSIKILETWSKLHNEDFNDILKI